MSTSTAGLSGLDIAATLRDIWDASADGDHGYGDLDSTDVQRQAWTILLSRLFPSTESLSVLDVGCGAGFVALAMADRGHTVTGLDISPRMLRDCRAAAEKRGLTDLRLVEGAAEQPPPDLGLFDVVICRNLLWTLPHPEKALAAWYDLVRPGGRVVGVDALWSAELIRATAGEKYPVDVLALLPLLHARDLDPVENLWRRAGLAQVMVEELRWIDAVLRSEVVIHGRPMIRRFGYYLVEGTRPHGDGEPR